ncbi:MAG TPA: DUF1854 domain-containing protein [Candidatus Hydrogenedentes bacterium]|nr:DUF1854 domain-containing protein [Candidatus Hydrogenedentota bacterium]
MPEAHAKAAVRVEREPHYDRLDPERVRLFRDGSGKLRMTIDGDRSYIEAKAVRAFPLSEPDRYIAFLTDKDKTIGMIEDIGALDADSQTLVRADLERRYFTPSIKRFLSLKEEYGAIYCAVETDHGPREFVARGIRDTLEDLGNGELLFADADGNRYRIANWRALDAKSRRFLERVV